MKNSSVAAHWKLVRAWQVALFAASVVCVSAVAAPLAHAHGGAHEKTMGTVQAVTTDMIMVSTMEDKVVHLTVDAQTVCERSGGKACSLAEVRPGDRVVAELRAGASTATVEKLLLGDRDQGSGAASGGDSSTHADHDGHGHDTDGSDHGDHQHAH